MSLPIITSYEIKTSRTEQKVPVVNGVHLHSIYNPAKEAENLVTAQIESLKTKNEVLILGLGFAYHVNAIIDKLSEFHGDDFKIIVIEPNVQVYDECVKLNLLHKKNIVIYSGFTSTELFSDLDLIHFLLKKPAMIAHPASFNLYQNYFKKVLTFEAPQDIGSIQDFIESPEIKKYLDGFDQSQTFEDVLYDEIPSKAILDEYDFLTMALNEMTKSNQPSKTSTGNK
jgi:hypothetical protein